MSNLMHGIKLQLHLNRSQQFQDQGKTGDLAYRTEQNNPSARAFIERCAKVPVDFNANIYIEDEVYLHGLKHLGDQDLALMLYFKYGAQIMDEIRQIAAWKFGNLRRVSSFLDFACGYGRSTRFLVQELPANRVWVSDIYARAIEFQQAQFGVNGFVSVIEPAQFVYPQKFDFIFVASLFSHLPERRFIQWLKQLHSMLTPHGVLAFSVHDEYILRDRPMPAAGNFFISDSESKYLDLAEYGTMFVTESFMRNLIQRVIGPNWPYHRIRRGLCGFQDVYLIPGNANEAFSDFHFRFGPEGHVDGCQMLPTGELRLHGWGGDPDDGKSVNEIQVLVNGQTMLTCTPQNPRPDVVAVLNEPKYANAGWECQLHAAQFCPQDILEVRAVASDGVSTLLHLSTVKAATDRPLS